MIIDFRVRPPYKSFLNMGMYTNPRFDIADRLNMPVYWGREYIPSVQEKSMPLFMQEMDEAKIDLAVIIGRKSVNPKAYGVTTMEDVKELMEQYPGRFEGFGAIDPQEEDAFAQIKKAKDFGFKGICLEPSWSYPALHFDDPKLDPIYTACAEMDLMVALTMSCLIGTDTGWTDPVCLARVAEKYPQINFIIPHGGWPEVAGMMGACVRCKNIYLIPDIYACIPSMPFAQEYVNAANSFMQHRMLFGSSYPARALKQMVQEWSNLAFTPEALQANLYDNAAYLLKL